MAYLKKNPALLDAWLKGVKTFSGNEDLSAVTAALKS
jgi:glycine betaine/proline transport system substrate-binding protein